MSYLNFPPPRLSGSSSLSSYFLPGELSGQQGGLGQGDLVPSFKGPRDEAAHSQAAEHISFRLSSKPGLILQTLGAAPSVFIFPWVERELLESCLGEAGYGGPNPQQLLEAQALCAGVGREWTFCLAFYSDRPSLALVLAWGC